MNYSLDTKCNETKNKQANGIIKSYYIYYKCPHFAGGGVQYEKYFLFCT